MSYPYDRNPWDDNYSSNQAGQPAQMGQTNYGGYYDGYTNPAASYPDQTGQQYQYQDEEVSQQQQQQPQLQQQTNEETKAPPESALRRFLRQRIPLCGTLMDCMSGINLPFLDALVQHVNRDLLVSKIFYFFFYSAFGSLFPLMGVYFKQLGMNPAQVGILTGVRPFIEIFSAPFWHSLAERFQKSKALLLFSLMSWIVFTYSLAHIRPPASACVAFNDTDYVLYTPYSANDLSNYDVGQLEESESSTQRSGNEMFMNKMPLSAGNEKEGKDEILASEENQNDQRRRRRRKRQVQGGPIDQSAIGRQRQSDRANGRQRYLYSLDPDGGNGVGNGAGRIDGQESSHLELDVDLENDFDDSPIERERNKNAGHSRPRGPVSPPLSSSSLFELDDSGVDMESAEYDELGQTNSRGSRHERSVSVKDIDDLLGESDEHEPESEPEENELEIKREDSDVGKVKEKSRETEGGGGGSGEGEEEGEEEAGDGDNATSNGKKDRGTVKSTGQQQSASNTANSAPTLSIPTTMASNEGAVQAGASGSQAVSTNSGQVNKTKRVFKQRHKTPPTHIVGMSPITVEYTVNYNKEKHGQFVAPMFSTIVYKLDDIKEVFFLLLLLISLGEFFSAPALTLADSATLSYLGDDTDSYGRQRMFGSFSWAITLLLVGMALDNATAIADHPCGPHQRERSYTVCFIIFSLLMACALLTATQFRFNYPKGGSQAPATPAPASGNQATAMITSTSGGSAVVTTTVDGSTGNIDELYASTQPRSIFNTAPPVNAPPSNGQLGSKEKFEFLDKWKSAVFAQRTWELPAWVNVFQQFGRNPLHLTYLFITWFLGCGVGLVFTFLFWHLQDVGGTPTLFGICSVINHISEILAYFFSFNFIKRFGHTKVLSVGLGCNVVRFMYVAFLTNPYYALPFELVQGITHAACFAACCSYISHVSKPELKTSTQGVMQGLHHGIGRACGALLGGYMINALGSRASFCIYGLLSGCVLAGFLYVRKKASQLEDEEVKVDDSEALGGYGAPQGVPSAIPGKMAQTVTAQDIDYQW